MGMEVDYRHGDITTLAPRAVAADLDPPVHEFGTSRVNFRIVRA